mmetsp:Transcript_67784/g.185886  ORF Transcript_67784/g.185886 Transcript_67784/m.185886 type:complete len:236 (-) Transcript_67784:1166-1873(-)
MHCREASRSLAAKESAYFCCSVSTAASEPSWLRSASSRARPDDRSASTARDLSSRARSAASASTTSARLRCSAAASSSPTIATQLARPSTSLDAASTSRSSANSWARAAVMKFSRCSAAIRTAFDSALSCRTSAARASAAARASVARDAIAASRRATSRVRLHSCARPNVMLSSSRAAPASPPTTSPPAVSPPAVSPPAAPRASAAPTSFSSTKRCCVAPRVRSTSSCASKTAAS